ncbi:PH domain-containing protein [Streptomyces liliifuscus]|uniref:PH domain-containing protein n=1 Tax=Streptomyces liliifuscus TaxID=2797636 RepID=A0A7T7L4D1_9ACTN|nr:PH domain-containing protein [Streptomyces liliifuscus]QQM46220.1 PH domain-containing protein [Streptomyces liliifuscus]
MHVFFWVIGLGTLSVLAALWGAEVPASLRYPFLAAWVALMGWLFYATLRCSTTADIKAIHARGMVKRRRLAWEDIQDIRAEVNPASAMQSGAPNVLVHAYGRDGSKVLLPFVDDLHVNVERELGLLLDSWSELRGADWAPDPQAAVLIDRRDARQAALMTGFTAVMLAFIPLTVLMLLPLFVDMPEWLESVLQPLLVMGVGAPLIFALTAITSYRGRRPSG